MALVGSRILIGYFVPGGRGSHADSSVCRTLRKCAIHEGLLASLVSREAKKNERKRRLFL